MKKWLLERFLPMWAKETVLQENRQLRQRVGQLEALCDRQLSYIRGLQFAVRHGKHTIRKEKE